MLNQPVMEVFEELLDERNVLRSELTTKDSLIEELRKENEVCKCLELRTKKATYICMHLLNTSCTWL